MRCFAELVFLFVSLAFVQGQPVVSEINDLNTILSSSEFQQYLSVDKLQQLRREIFATTLTCLGNHYDLAAIAQVLEQLITQYVPQVKQMHIEYDNDVRKVKIIPFFFVLVGSLLVNQLLMMLSSLILMF
jgi:hypothetical protein